MTNQEKIVVSAYTGVLMCDFGDVHKYIEEKLCRPVYTHGMAQKALWDEIKEKSKDDFMTICKGEPHWIPCSERLPKPSEHKDDMVLVCYGNGSMRFDTCMNGEWVYGNPIAWMPLPEPYEDEQT